MYSHIILCYVYQIYIVSNTNYLIVPELRVDEACQKKEEMCFWIVTGIVRDNCFEFLLDISNNKNPSLFESKQVQILGKRAYNSFNPKGIQEAFERPEEPINKLGLFPEDAVL